MARITDEREMRRRAWTLANKEWEEFMENKSLYTEESMRQLIEEPQKWINARCKINYEAHVEKNKEFERKRIERKESRYLQKKNRTGEYRTTKSTGSLQDIRDAHNAAVKAFDMAGKFSKAEQTFIDAGTIAAKERAELKPFDYNRFRHVNLNPCQSTGDGPSYHQEYHCEVLDQVVEHDAEAQQTIEWAMRDIDSGPMATRHISMWTPCTTAWRQDVWEEMFL